MQKHFNFIYYKNKNELNTIIIANGTTWTKNIVFNDKKQLTQHLKYMFGKGVDINVDYDNDYLLSGSIGVKKWYN